MQKLLVFIFLCSLHQMHGQFRAHNTTHFTLKYQISETSVSALKVLAIIRDHGAINKDLAAVGVESFCDLCKSPDIAFILQEERTLMLTLVWNLKRSIRRFERYIDSALMQEFALAVEHVLCVRHRHSLAREFR